MKKIAIYLAAAVLVFSVVLVQSCRKEDNKPRQELAVKSFYPNSGNGGTLVTILGTGFDDNATVSFGTVAADVLNVNDTSMVVRAPKDGQTGKISYKSGDKTLDVGTYTYQALSVQSFFPTNGPAGMHVRISGAGFSSLNTPAEVLVNGVSALVVSANDTLIVAEIPVDAGAGPITVKVNGQTSTGASFRFQAISSIKPMTGNVGTKVTINGSGFDAVAAGNIVEFNGKSAVVAEASEDKLVVIAPEGVATGPVTVRISGQLVAGPAFTPVPAPQISVVSPLSGPAGQEMTINGMNFSSFTDENIVKINGVPVPVKTASGTKLTLTLPGGTGNGKVEVVVNDQPVTGPDFRDQNLGVVSVSPASGLAGTKVTITGVGFSTVPAENIVTFNSVAAVVESATETSLVVTAPAALTTGELKVTRAALNANAPSEFRRAGTMTLYKGALISFSASAMAIDSKGNAYVSDRNNAHIVKVTPDGNATVWAGSAGMGYKDGSLAEAQFGAIYGLAFDAQDNLYVSETGNFRNIRKITPAGVVTTVKTGINGAVGRLALDKSGNMYITQTWSGVLKIYPTGQTEPTLRSSVSDNCTPAVDAKGNVYAGQDDYQGIISRYDATAKTSTLYWLGAQDAFGFVDGPRATARLGYGFTALVIDNNGSLLVLDKNNYAIRKFDFATNEMSTLARFAGLGYADGSFDQAKFSFGTIDMKLGADGSIYILDQGNSAIRKVFLR
ncbi:IPT/TIG domain-containing protein [Chitinophaga horti]|uniref:IPT/TIG domain-containing protein n=1 Tax=Chitinophaga horti TaxID=2920382 RepID=A0ABY6JBE6_9BACT|nr:IPT/TIG domain-containing protein [Chitinophaga horti]UYQ95639.1 IPT/TIG domain-containing protein [Chitinophaga horti]